jgi:quercetin dioxygenase-like cupin family protein
MFLTTLTFLFSTPGWEPSLGGFPALSAMPGQFLLKDIVLLAAALWSLGEALPEARQREAMEAKRGRGDANGVGLVARSTANALAGLAVTTGLAVAVGLALAADPPDRAASTGEGETVKTLFSEKLPNVPGKTLTVVSVDYRHPASGFVFAYVLSGAIRSQVEGEPLGVYRVGQRWTEPPNAHHIVSANASKTKPARLIAYIIADDGAEPTVYDK